MQSKKLLIMAGGTGGHVFPGLALAEEMQSRGYGIDWLGTSSGLEARLVKDAGIPLHFIPVRGLRGKGLRNFFMAPWNIMSSLAAALSVIKRLKPCVVVGLGGFVAGPGGLAARLLGVPLLIHEQNAVAGTTNRLLSIFARRVLTAFPNVLKNAICIGNPVRKSLEQIAPPETRFAERQDRINLLIVGGSRGALAINTLIPAAIAQIKTTSSVAHVDILHQAGEGKEPATQDAYAKADVQATVVPFISDMAQAYAWADIVICRAGALTVSELSAVGLGSILIPFPYAIDDHQTANARYLEEAGAALLRQQADLNPEVLASVLTKLFADRNVLLTMANCAKSVAKPRSVEVFADYCEELANV